MLRDFTTVRDSRPGLHRPLVSSRTRGSGWRVLVFAPGTFILVARHLVFNVIASMFAVIPGIFSFTKTCAGADQRISQHDIHSGSGAPFADRPDGLH
ncbi:conserved hypothetical protein [Cupriavidus necator H16]|uniref:Uncharacterized protein n=1 Tax=Cupriavidus necator (strain ATCC 17699 / DSM 428 / KCTC 22496 / NCIMB 10442 / H16 / Stanier 337) TaxID=381666 RepID=Q0JZL9_CUPNH|nr:conserved hypothetical protein [Cupriavidus necator H16]